MVQVSRVVSWVIVKLPKAKHSQFKPVESEFGITHNWNEEHPDPNQKRWMPFKFPEEPTCFLKGLHTVCGAG